MKTIPKYGVKGSAHFGNYWVASSYLSDYPQMCRIFSEARAKELLKKEEELKKTGSLLTSVMAEKIRVIHELTTHRDRYWAMEEIARIAQENLK